MISPLYRAYRSLLAVLALLLAIAPFAAHAADYTAGADLVGGTATLWFKSSVGSTWTDAHYKLNGGAQQNVRMAYNSGKGRFETSFAASAGQVVSHAFTYDNNGLAYDSPSTNTTLATGGSGGTAAAPNFSLAPGSYSSAQRVAITTSTAGATIRYTTDGSTPTASSPVYSSAINVAASMTLKAYASASGMTDSGIATASYTINTGGGFSYSNGVSVSGNTAVIWFQPSTTIGYVDLHFSVANGPQQNMRMVRNSSTGRYERSTAVVAGNVVKYWFTYNITGATQYDTGAYSYTVNSSQKAATPSFSPAAGTYSSAQTVTLGSSTPGAQIRYTTDGSTPTASSPLYAGALTVSRSQTIKAFASASGYADSQVSSAAYTIDNGGSGFVQGVYELGTTATVWLKPSGSSAYAILHYALNNGSEISPKMSFNSALGRFEFLLTPVKPGDTLKYFITYAAGAGQIDTPRYSYTIGGPSQVAKPTLSPVGGNYASSQSVQIFTTEANATIRYTTDGSAPNASSPRYVGPITVSNAKTINAITLKHDGSQSGIASETYVISDDETSVATPTISHASGSYGQQIAVSFLSATNGATIFYTLDGSTPTRDSTIYGGPVWVRSSATVKAVAIKGGLSSGVASASYTIGNGSGETWNGKTTFNIVNSTKGKWSDDKVYWSIIGKDWNTGNFVHVDLNGNLIPMRLADNGALVKNGTAYTNYFYSLAQTKSITIPAINSARLLMSVGEPMYIQVNADINGKIGYAGADIENPTDPNTDVIFDFGEFAILPIGSNPQGIFINTTRVDQFGFPLRLNVTGLDGFDMTVGESLSETREEIFAKFIAEVPAPFRGLAQAPYAPYRIMAPAHASFGKDGVNERYLDTYISAVWDKYRNEDLVMDLKNGWPVFTGRVVGDTFRFTDGAGTYNINGKPTTAMVMLGAGLLDDPKGTTDIGKQLQLQAQMCAALNRHVAGQSFDKWWHSPAFYPAGAAANYFTKFWHDHSLNALAYGFAYDDVGGYSPSIHTAKPKTVTYTIGW